jgi:predicted aspartyl protease
MWRLFPLILLAACAHDGTGSCRMQQVADLAATVDQNGLGVTGQVEHTDIRLAIDTAAAETVLTPATASTLLLARAGGSHNQQSGHRHGAESGTTANANAFADISLGTADFQRQFRVADATKLGGVIGADLLSDYDLELDLPDHRLRLWRAPGCGLADLPWTGPHEAVPMQVTGGELLRLPVTIDGQTVEAVLDTAAPVSLLQANAARRLGVTSAQLSADTTIAAHGVGGGAAQARLHRFGAIIVGQDRVVGPRIGVADFPLETGEMVLSLDYLADRHVWVSYRTGQVFILDGQTGRPEAPARFNPKNHSD